MENENTCFICYEDKLNENVIPTLCSCIGMVTHFNCIKKIANIPSQFYCTVCKNQFNGILLKKLKKRYRIKREKSKLAKIQNNKAIRVNNNKALKKSRIRTLAFIAFLIVPLYIYISYSLVNRDYLIPKRIKNNLVESECNATDIRYGFNNETSNEYFIVSAYGTVTSDSTVIKSTDLTKIVEGTSCEICPSFIVKLCYVYIKSDKIKYLVKNKNDVNYMFNDLTYGLFIIIIGLIIFITMTYYTVVLYIDSD